MRLPRPFGGWGQGGLVPVSGVTRVRWRVAGLAVGTAQLPVLRVVTAPLFCFHVYKMRRFYSVPCLAGLRKIKKRMLRRGLGKLTSTAQSKGLVSA